MERQAVLTDFHSGAHSHMPADLLLKIFSRTFLQSPILKAEPAEAEHLSS